LQRIYEISRDAYLLFILATMPEVVQGLWATVEREGAWGPVTSRSCLAISPYPISLKDLNLTASTGASQITRCPCSSQNVMLPHMMFTLT